MKKRLGDQGFTLIELLITVAILGILAAILVPSYTQYIASSKAKVCEINRLQFVHSFKIYKVYDGGNYTLAAAVNGQVPALSAEQQALKCPSGGTISATNTSIDCTLHGSLSIDLSDGGGDNGGGGTPGGTLKPGDKILGDSVTLKNWETDAALAASSGSGGIHLIRGAVYVYGGKTYAVGYNTWLTKEDGSKFGTNPGAVSILVEFDPSKTILPSNYGTGSKWTPSLEPKSVLRMGADSYLFMGATTVTHESLPPGGNWIKIS